MRLYEAKQLELSTQLTKRVEDAICSVLCMVTQAHIWHWQTRSYAEHKALGDFYENLQDKVDELAEIFFGAGGEFRFTQHKDTSNFVSKEDTVAKLQDFKSQLVSTEAELMKDENSLLHSAGDTLLDIIKGTDKLLYLLKLE